MAAHQLYKHSPNPLLSDSPPLAPSLPHSLTPCLPRCPPLPPCSLWRKAFCRSDWSRRCSMRPSTRRGSSVPLAPPPPAIGRGLPTLSRGLTRQWQRRCPCRGRITPWGRLTRSSWDSSLCQTGRASRCEGGGGGWHPLHFKEQTVHESPFVSLWHNFLMHILFMYTMLVCLVCVIFLMSAMRVQPERGAGQCTPIMQ